uniref:Uncharacterized protein n=1 Tax=Parascaris equorum TaxID=6256 RepID=A0A914RA85_PAREQ
MRHDVLQSELFLREKTARLGPSKGAATSDRPKNFTDRCNDDEIDPRYVPITHCPTICIRMWEEPIVAGKYFIYII